MIVTSWNLKHLCENNEKWQELGNQLEKKIEMLKTCLSNTQTVADIKLCIETKIEMDKLMEQIYCYPRRLLDLDNQNNDAKAMFEKAFSYYEETEKIKVLFEKMIVEKKSLVDEFLLSFPHFKRYVELIWQMNEHQVSNEEAYVTLKKELETLKERYRSLIRDDIVLKDIETGEPITEETLSKLSHSKNPVERKRAFEIMMTAYKNVANTLATIYQNKIMVEEKIAKQKGFQSHLDACLYENILPNSMISDLVATVNDNLEIEHDFMQYQKEMQGLEELHLYDMGQSFIPNVSKKIPIEEAVSIVKQSISILGEDYVQRLEEGFSKGWLDLTIHKNKRKDSFSCITYSGAPYTMLQYKGNMNSLRVLAHETGHMIHTSYAKENEFEYFEYSLFLAEIASKVHEILLFHHLIKESENKEEMRYFIEQLLSNFCTSLFSQTMLTEFELEVHKKLRNQEPIEAEFLSSLYLSLAQKYYGKSFVADELVGYNFEKIPHFYLYPSYYVWQYSIGISIAHKIAADLIDDKNNMRKQYLEFLKAGNRLSVTESLKLVGIDLENGAYIEDACKFMKEKMKLLKR